MTNDGKVRTKLLIVFFIIVAIAVAAVLAIPEFRYDLQDMFSNAPMESHGEWWEATREEKLAWANWLREDCDVQHIPAEVIVEWAEGAVDERGYGHASPSASLRHVRARFLRERYSIESKMKERGR